MVKERNPKALILSVDDDENAHILLQRAFTKADSHATWRLPDAGEHAQSRGNHRQTLSTFYMQEKVDADKPARELTIAIREGRHEEEGWRVRKDGTQFWASVVITALWDKRGNLTGFAKVTRDLTERKRERGALRTKTEELETFAHTLSHDLRSDAALQNANPAERASDWHVWLQKDPDFRRPQTRSPPPSRL